MMQLFKTQLGRFRVLAFMEGVSFLIILFITMPLKYIYEYPQPNQFFGLAHGLLFISYVFAVIRLTIEYRWNLQKTCWALLASVLPFGTFWADRVLFQPMDNQ